MIGYLLTEPYSGVNKVCRWNVRERSSSLFVVHQINADVGTPVEEMDYVANVVKRKPAPRPA